MPVAASTTSKRRTIAFVEFMLNEPTGASAFKKLGTTSVVLSSEPSSTTMTSQSKGSASAMNVFLNIVSHYMPEVQCSQDLSCD